MADWRVAKGLDKLLDQINGIAPTRSKRLDGSLGDEAHQARRSDHNPDDEGVVRARDFTHDPDAGADMWAITEQLRLSRDRRIKYVIWYDRIFSSYRSAGGTTTGPGEAWEWRSYNLSSDPVAQHRLHAHVSTVADDTVADNTDPWQITTNKETDMPLLPMAYGDGYPDGEMPQKRSDVGYLQERLNIVLAKGERITVDGYYGDATVTAMVKALGLPGTGPSDKTGRLCTGGHWFDLEQLINAKLIDAASAGAGGLTVDQIKALIAAAVGDHEAADPKESHPHTHGTGQPR